MKVIVHRTGPLEAAENSLAGIVGAPGWGADAVELDVRLTRDRVPVLLHDHTTWRTAARPLPVRWMSSRAFTSLRHRGGAQTLPTLRGALEALPAGLEVAIDVKDHRAVDAVVELVGALGLHERSMVWVRRPADIARVAAVLPPRQIALLHNSFDEAASLRYVHHAHACGAGQVSIHQDGVTSRVVAEAERLGLIAWVWVTAADAHARVIETGAHGVVTDWPALARSLVG